MGQIKILIGIQARSNSTRFPGKIYEYVGNRRVLDHVIDRANSAASHVTRYRKEQNLKCLVAVLHPSDDKRLIDTFRSNSVQLISGPEQDVLARFVNAQSITGADYIVRLTSDCPLIFDYIIAKHINVATFQNLDYVNNVDEACRCIADGFDCEIMSKRALSWLDQNAKGDEREHVTLALRKHRPAELTYGFILPKLDTSNMKMSVDTQDDLDRVRAYYHQHEAKRQKSDLIYGRNIYEL